MIEDERAQKVLRDVVDEERVHAGDYLRLLIQLDPEEVESCFQGAWPPQRLPGFPVRHGDHFIDDPGVKEFRNEPCSDPLDFMRAWFTP
jgi:hypothetical protein